MVLGSMGRASFAVLAVVLLGLVNVAAAQTAMTEQAQRDEARRVTERDAAMALLETGGLQARWLATRAAAETVREGSLSDLQLVQTRFRDRLNASLAAAFPLEGGGASVAVREVNLTLAIETALLEDAPPVPALVPRAAGAGTYRTPDPGAPRGLEEAPVAAGIRLLGRVTLEVRGRGVQWGEVLAVDEALPGHLPFLEARVRDYARAVEGGTEVRLTVRSMLATLVQFRVLQGYAWSVYGMENATLAEVLTSLDVEVAVNLALLLEQIRLFRSYDAAAAAGLDAALGREPGSVDGLLARHAVGGEVDPADLLFIVLGLEGQVLDLGGLLAQALYARADQSGLKYLEYFGLKSVADFLVSVADTAASLIDGFITWVSETVTGTSREAQIVREYFEARLAGAGTTDDLLGPQTASTPSLSFLVASDGTNYSIALPATETLVSLPPVSFLEGNDPLWESYFEAYLKGDLRKVHDSVESLVKDVAEALAKRLFVLSGALSPTLRLDPKDGVSVGEEILGYLRNDLLPAVRGLREHPEALAAVVGKVREAEAAAVRTLAEFVDGHYGTFVGRDAAVGTIRSALLAALRSEAAAAANYSALNDTARERLDARLVEASQGEWAGGIYETARRVDRDRLLDAADRLDNGTGAPLPAAMVDAFLGSDGLLLAAAETVVASADSLVAGTSLVAQEIQVPTPALPFRFRTNVSGTPVTSAEFTVAVDSGGYRNASVLGVRLGLPTAFPSGEDNPNVHHTALLATSDRPFETAWSVSLAGPVNVTASIGEGSATAVSGFESSVLIVANSGGPLAGVTYASTNNVADDLKAIAARILNDVVRPVLDFLRDLGRGVVDALLQALEVLQRIAEEVQGLIEWLGNVLHDATNLVRYALDLLGEALGRILGDLVCGSGPREFAFHLGGFRFEARLCQEAGMPLQVAVVLLGFRVELQAVDFDAIAAPPGNVTGHDLLVRFDGAWGDLAAHAVIDPRQVYTESAVFEGRVTGGGWVVDLRAPVIEETFLRGFWAAATVETPIGEISIEAGFVVTLSAPLDEWSLIENLTALVRDLLNVTLRESVEAFAGRLQRAIARAVQVVEDWLRRELGKLVEVALYLEGSWGVPGAGLGFRLSFVVGGDAVRTAFEWVADHILVYLKEFGRTMPPVDLSTFPMTVTEDLWVRGELFGGVEVPQGYFGPVGPEASLNVMVEANVAGIASLLGYDWGAPALGFGAYYEAVVGSLGFWSSDARAYDLWLLQGEAHPA